LQAKARCSFLPRRCERGADWAPLHDCKASEDGPFQSLPNTSTSFLPITDECQPNMSHRSLFCATKSRQIVHDRTIGGSPNSRDLGYDDGTQCDTVQDGSDGPNDRGRFHGHSPAPAAVAVG